MKETRLAISNKKNKLHGTEPFLTNSVSPSLSRDETAFCRTRRFITVFTRVRHWPLYRATWIQYKQAHPVL